MTELVDKIKIEIKLIGFLFKKSKLLRFLDKWLKRYILPKNVLFYSMIYI